MKEGEFFVWGNFLWLRLQTPSIPLDRGTWEFYYKSYSTPNPSSKIEEGNKKVPSILEGI
jgi:hypothetical protein